MKISIRLAAVSLLAASLQAIGLAAAATDSATAARSIAVDYHDLSLDRPADVARLYQRIRAAADQVCGPREVTGSRLPARAYQPCVDAAVGHSVTAVASPALRAYYESHSSAAAAYSTKVAER
jgi:UrcA family protein